MRIATRLVLTLGVAVAAVVAVYGLITMRQREAMLRAALIRETETLAWALVGAAKNAVPARRFTDLDSVLQHAITDSETFAGVLLDENGRTLAGGADSELACVRDLLPATRAVTEEISGWADCDGPVRWVVSPVAPPDTTLLLARRASLVEQDIASSRLRHLLLTLVLIATTALVIYLVLGRILSAPLESVLGGVRRLGSGSSKPIHLPESAGELTTLAGAFNRMVERLEQNRVALIAESEERLALERRLREAEKFAAVGRLTGGVAHELGSPLNVIAMRAETITSAPSAPAALRHQAEEIIAEVDRITDLVHGLLHVARRHGIRAQPIELNDVVNAAVAEVQADADAGRISMEIEQAEPPVIVAGDATLLRHAILNLLRNSIHALKTHSGPRHVSVHVQRGGAQVCMTIEDSGPGIADQDLEHIFEPFFTTKDIGEGTGLGLAISRGIVEEHGGHLELTSGADSAGVCATIILPLPAAGTPERTA